MNEDLGRKNTEMTELTERAITAEGEILLREEKYESLRDAEDMEVMEIKERASKVEGGGGACAVKQNAM